jgi:YihY family inner membrane protein
VRPSRRQNEVAGPTTRTLGGATAMTPSRRAILVGRGARRVLGDFRRNQGLLLAGAVAYYTLLSLVPLFAVLLVVLSHLIDRQRLVNTIAVNLELVMPGHSATVIDQVTAFLAHRQVIGTVGSLGLLFFSSMAFSVLENAMGLIFHHRRTIAKRHLLVSAVIPYLFVMLLGAGLLLVALMSSALEAVGRRSLELLGHAYSLASLSRWLLHLLGMTGLALLLTALYMVLPVPRIALRSAIIGAVAATALWEVVRRALVWYFATLSMVNVIYGSLATVVIVLLTLEAAALILLLGAQLVAEVERGRRQRRAAAI